MEFILTTDCTDPAAAGRIRGDSRLHGYIVTWLHRYIGRRTFVTLVTFLTV